MWVVSLHCGSENGPRGTVRAQAEKRSSCICINLKGLEAGAMYELTDSQGRLWYSTRADSTGSIVVWDGAWLQRVALRMEQSPASFLQLEQEGVPVTCAKIQHHDLSQAPRRPRMDHLVRKSVLLAIPRTDKKYYMPPWKGSHAQRGSPC